MVVTGTYFVFLCRCMNIFCYIRTKYHTMEMLQHTLQTLFEGKVLAATDGILAERLGYKSNSRTTIGRIKRGEYVSPETLETVWRKVCEEFYVDEKDVVTIARSMRYGEELYNAVCATDDGGVEWGDTVLGAIITEDYNRLSSLGEAVVKGLKEMRLQEPDVFYGALGYCYMLCKGVNPYTQRGRKRLAQQLNGLNSLLIGLYPGNNRAYESASTCIRINLEDTALTVFKLVYNLKLIIWNYVDVAYYETMLRERGLLFDVGEVSYWITPGETFHDGCELWCFSVIGTKSENRGEYIAMRLRAESRSKESFKLVESYIILFVVNEGGGYDIMQAYDIPTGRIEFALYSYNKDSRLLGLCFDGAPSCTFNLPELLHCIDLDHPTTKDEKVWANIIENTIENKFCKFLLSAVNASTESNLEYLADYDVTNICIDRRSLTVTFINETTESCYSIPLDKYKFFNKLTPAEFASVVRYKDSGEFAICWNFIGQNVPLCEFEKQWEKPLDGESH